MKTCFYLLLSLRTADRYDVCGEFFVGNNRAVAEELFGSLRGNPVASEPAYLHIDLMEAIDDMPEKIESKCCTLEEWCFNSRIIIKELFRLKNLEEYS